MAGVYSPSCSRAVCAVALLALLFRNPAAPAWSRSELVAELFAVVVTGALGLGFAYLAMAPLQLSADGLSLAEVAIAIGVFAGLVVVLGALVAVAFLYSSPLVLAAVGVAARSIRLRITTDGAMPSRSASRSTHSDTTAGSRTECTLMAWLAGGAYSTSAPAQLVSSSARRASTCVPISMHGLLHRRARCWTGPAVPRDLETVVRKAMDKDPAAQLLLDAMRDEQEITIAANAARTAPRISSTGAPS